MSDTTSVNESAGLSTVCDKSPTGRHQLQYREQARVFTEGNELRSVCNYCGIRIRRAHRKSAWWWAA